MTLFALQVLLMIVSGLICGFIARKSNVLVIIISMIVGITIGSIIGAVLVGMTAAAASSLWLLSVVVESIVVLIVNIDRLV